MLLQDAKVRPRHEARDEHERREPQHGRDDDAAPGPRQPRPPHADDEDDGEREEQVGELEADREAQGHLPRGHEPPGDDGRRATSAIAAQQEKEGEWHSTAREHMQVPVLRELPRRIGKGGAHSRGADPSDPELAGEQVRAEERKHVGEEEEQVVAEQRRVRARPARTGRRARSRRAHRRTRACRRSARTCSPATGGGVRPARACPIHATCHVCSSGSPVSFPMSLPRWRTSGQVITIARTPPATATKSASRQVRSRALITRGHGRGGARTASRRAAREPRHRRASSARTTPRAGGS